MIPPLLPFVSTASQASTEPVRVDAIDRVDGLWRTPTQVSTDAPRGLTLGVKSIGYPNPPSVRRQRPRSIFVASAVYPRSQGCGWLPGRLEQRQTGHMGGSRRLWTAKPSKVQPPYVGVGRIAIIGRVNHDNC